MRTWILIAGLVAAAAAVLLVLRRRAASMEEEELELEEAEIVLREADVEAEAVQEAIAEELGAEEEAPVPSAS